MGQRDPPSTVERKIAVVNRTPGRIYEGNSDQPAGSGALLHRARRRAFDPNSGAVAPPFAVISQVKEGIDRRTVGRHSDRPAEADVAVFQAHVGRIDYFDVEPKGLDVRVLDRNVAAAIDQQANAIEILAVVIDVLRAPNERVVEVDCNVVAANRQAGTGWPGR